MRTTLTLLAAIAVGANAADEPVAAIEVSQNNADAGGGCPNDCSNNGYCRNDAKCLCFAGFVGYDCSKRECPSSLAWSYDGAILQTAVECSYRGSCDRTTGECACYQGFEGAACDRTACPNDCSGHGRCKYISELPLASSYVSWEQDRIQACECDGGYFGSDCSLRMCPNGDDPQSVCTEQDKQVQIMTLTWDKTSEDPLQASGNTVTFAMTDLDSNSDDWTLSFTDVHGNTWTTRAIVGFWDLVRSDGSNSPATAASRIEQAIEELPNFVANGVTVYVSPTGAAANTAFNVATDEVYKIRIEFDGTSVAGSQPKLSCPTPFVGCPFPGCQPKYGGPRLVKYSATANFKLAGVTGDYDYLPQPAERHSVSEPNNIGVQVSYTAGTANGVATFGVQAKNRCATGTGCSDGSSAISGSTFPYTTDNRFKTSGLDIGMGLRIKFTAADESAIDALGGTTETVHIQVPGCAVEIQDDAGENYESLECSGRGMCNRDSGLCSCFEGYSGAACNEVHMSI